MLTQTNFDNRFDYAMDQFNGKPFVQGSGFTGTGTLIYSGARRFGEMVKTKVWIDLTGLNSSAAADIIGGNGLANCWFGQIKDGINGIPKEVRMECTEVPAGGEPDIDIYMATEATGTEDAAITGLDETVVGAVKYADISGLDMTDKYLYLVGSGGGTDGTYTAGRFNIEFTASLT